MVASVVAAAVVVAVVFAFDRCVVFVDFQLIIKKFESGRTY